MVMSNGNGGTAIHREEFGARELAVSNERQQAAIVARVTAEIQARSIVAMQRPRDLLQVREALLMDAARPGFAAVARYRKPLGSRKNDETGEWEKTYAEGPSIRFVEAAMRAYRNCVSDSMITEDSTRQRTVRVTVTDLEANVTHAQDVTFAKTIERRDAKGRIVLASRKNSYGDTVYIVEATDDEALVKHAALVSKAVRTLGLRVVPGDIVEEAMERCLDTIERADGKDPAAALKGVVDAFSKIGVRAEHLAEYLGHPVDQCTQEEIVELRAVGVGIRDGDTSWKDAVESKLAERKDRASGESAKATEEIPTQPGGSKIDQLKAKLAQKQSPKEPAKPETAAATQPAQAATAPATDPKRADPPAQTQPATEPVNPDAEDPGPPDAVAEQLAATQTQTKRAPMNAAPAQGVFKASRRGR